MTITVSQIKEVNDIALRVMDSRLSNQYGIEYLGSTIHANSSDHPGGEVYCLLNDGQDTTNANSTITDLATPTISTSGLTITTDLGQLVVNDQHTVVADPTDTTYVKISFVIDDATSSVEVYAFEKTTGIYGDLPAGKTLAVDFKEYSTPANGTTLTEVISGD